MAIKKVTIKKYPKVSKYVCLYFHAHQPFRLSNYSIFDLGSGKNYFEGPNDQSNEFILKRVAKRGYNPANKMFLDLINKYNLKVSYSLSGTLLEQLQELSPDTIKLFQDLVSTKNVEMIGETYYHSLSYFYSVEDFIHQVTKHSSVLNKLFSYKPSVFRNTELTYRDDVGEVVRRLGFKAIFAEGWDPILEWRSPNYIYKANKVAITNKDAKLADLNKLTRAPKDIKLLLKNYRKSDDIAFRFQLKDWEGYPVTADKFATWVSNEPGEIINLFMDYETIGEHHRAESGIFEFYKHLPEELAKVGVEFILPTEAIKQFKPKDELRYEKIVSWADQERDLSAWLGNSIQNASINNLYELKTEVYNKLKKMKNVKQKSKLEDIWGKLQTSDHFYYMSTKYWSDGDVHKYFSPFKSPYEAYITFSNILRDFKIQFLGY